MSKSRRKGGGSKGSKGFRGGEGITESFTFDSNVVLVAGSAAIPVIPSNGALSPRATTVSDAWALYCVRRLKFRLRKATLTGPMAAGFILGVTDTVPSTFGQVSEIIKHTTIVSSDTEPSAWCMLSGKALRGYQPWYKTVAGSPDTSVEVQGVIYLAGTGTDLITIQIEVEISFSQPLATVDTPLARGAYKVIRDERLRLALAAKARLAGTVVTASIL